MPGPVLRIPGVYVHEPRVRAAPVLTTGVPAFIGCVAATAPVPPGAPESGKLYGPVRLQRKGDLPAGALAYLEHAVGGFFDNGGTTCYVVGVRELPSNASAAAAAMLDALKLLAPLDDVDLLAVPDAVALQGVGGGLDEALALVVQRGMIEHCHARGHCIALLDALPGKPAQALLDDQLKKLGIPALGAVDAALYAPWLRTVATAGQLVPPCGHVAGIIARTDAQAGVFQAPANVEILGATDLEAELDIDSVQLLHEAGINCLRAFAARGIRLWGARTLSRDGQWQYLNVRRLVLTVLRWIELNMTWAAFEPNVPALWARIQRQLSTYLTRLWRQGALQGATAEAAFYVRCDAELNPLATREIGQVITEIGLAPTLPAEFIVVSVQHRAGTTELI